MCLLSFLKWGSIRYPLGIVQWDFTRRDHPENPRRVSGSGLVKWEPFCFVGSLLPSSRSPNASASCLTNIGSGF